jgi:tape measure domain-containing protein
MGKRFIPIILTGDDKQVVATFTRTFDLIESRAKRLNSSLSSISKEATRVAREVDATLRASGGGASPFRNLPGSGVPEAARAAREVARINADTVRQAEQQDRLRERAARTLSDVQTREAKRAANEYLKSEADKVRAAEQSVQRIQAAGRGLATIGAGLTATLTLPLVAGGKAAVDSAVKYDSLKRGLYAVEGSAEAVERRMGSLREIAKLPGIGFEEAIKGSIRLQAVGFEAGRAEKLLIQFANAVALTGGGRGELERITVQLGQMSSKSKILAQDLKPIIEAAPAVGKALKQAFGTVDSEELSKLGLTTEQFIDKLVAELEKLPRVSGGAKNAIENFSDTADIAFSKLGNAILPLFTTALNATAVVLDVVSSGFEKLPGPVQRAIVIIGAILAVIGPLLLALAGVVAAIGFVKAQLLTLTPVIAKAGIEMSTLSRVMSLSAVGWIALAALAASLVVSLIQWATATREVNVVSREALETTKKRIAEETAELEVLQNSRNANLKVGESLESVRAQREALIAAKRQELEVDKELAKAQGVQAATAFVNALKNQSTAQAELMSWTRMSENSTMDYSGAVIHAGEALTKAQAETKTASEGLKIYQQVTGASTEEVLSLVKAQTSNKWALEQVTLALNGNTEAQRTNLSATEERTAAIERQEKAVRDLKLAQDDLTVDLAGVNKLSNELINRLVEFRARGGDNMRVFAEQQRAGLKQNIELAERLAVANAKAGESAAETLKRRDEYLKQTGGELYGAYQALLANEKQTKSVNDLENAWKKKGKTVQTELQRLTRQVLTLTGDLDSFTNLSSKEFELRFKVEGMERTKRDFERILDLRRDLDQPLTSPLPSKDDPAALRETIRSLERQKHVKEQIEELTREQANAEDRLQVAQARAVAAATSYNRLLDEGAKNKLLAAKLGDMEAEQAERIRDAELQTQALREERYRRQGRPTLQTGLGLALDPKASALLQQDLLEQTTLYNQAIEVRIDGARKASLYEENVRREQLGKFYEESATRQAIITEETAARQKAENDAVEQIRRNEVILQQGLISLDVDLTRARSEQSVERLRHERENKVAITLLEEELRDAIVRDASYVRRVLQDSERSRLENRKHTIDSIISLEAQLRGFQAGDPETLAAAQERAQVSRLQASISLKERIVELEGQIANAGEDASDRYRVAWLEAVKAVQDADVQAVESQIASQVKLADATVLHSEQVRARVLEHLAEQKTVTEGWADGIIGTYDQITGALDKGIDKLTGGLTLVNSLLKSIAHQLVNRLFQRFLDAFFPASSGGSASAIPSFGGQSSGGGGGFGGIIQGIFGGLFGGKGGTAPFNPNASSGVASLVASFAGDSGIKVPTSLGEQSAKATEIKSILHEAAHSASGAAPASGSLLAGLTSAGPAALIAYGAQVLSDAFSGNMSNRQALISGGLLPYFINRSALRRKEETIRDAVSNDTGTAIWALIGQAQAGNLSLSEATTQFAQIKTRYFEGIAGIKDSKTKRIANDTWNHFQALWPVLEAAARASEQAAKNADLLIPEFKDGGATWRRFADGGMTHPMFRDALKGYQALPDNFLGRVPGVYDRKDNIQVAVSGDEVILPPKVWKPIRSYLKAQRLPGFADGGGVSDGPTFSLPSSNQKEGKTPIHITANIYFNGKEFVIESMESDEGREVTFETMSSYEGQKVTNGNYKQGRKKGSIR